ncbi:unnamed protein product [Allacma fusca]|uniref:FAM20 C-terminal domain-containing protein n=1 Tax=Allacma fusca TaxID=39272 RepID=A0A8J2J293_9HEXA|nr:unnamed protein product [Allacma fusca]
MICVIRRYHVTNVMAFLIVTMIMVNLYALAVVIGGRAIPESRNAPHDQKKSDQVIFSSNITSTRFVALEDGSLHIFSNLKLKSPNLYSVLDAIKRRYNELQEENRTAGHYLRVVNRIKRALSLSSHSGNKIDADNFWSTAAGWPFPMDSNQFQSMGEILWFANRAQILQAKNSKRGTQLKVEVVLEGGQVGLFKPAWYPHGVVINGTAYGGKDRHFGEIAAFYLNQILGYNSAPITLGRRVNLSREILNFATDQLKETFFRDRDNNLCFYGVCYYCKSTDPVCAQGDNIDGALILLLDKKLRIIANPWRRTYKEKIQASWETDISFCSTVLKDSNLSKRNEALLDVVAVAIFDFLVGNADRHHFEMYADVKEQPTSKSHSRSIFLIDNGKSFGNSDEDYIDILAPLYQCCKIRRSLFLTLNKFRGVLGKSLEAISNFDTLSPLLTKHHLSALDRRLLIVLATVQVCLDRYSQDEVIL